MKQLKYIGILLSIFFILVQSACKDDPSDVKIYGSQPGQYIPAFEIPDKDGSVVTREDFIGKTTLIVFWASWCGYCINEIDELNQIYNDFKDNNVEVVGISLDENRTAWVTKVLERDMQYIQLHDKDAFDADFAVACNVTSIPKMILIDGDGKVLMVTTKASQITDYLHSQGY